MSVDFASLSPAAQEALLNGPALKPPDGVDPNFTNPPRLDTLTYTILSLSLFLSTLFIVLRAYGKWYLIKSTGLSDYLLIIAYLFYIGYISIFFYTLSALGFHATFVHQWDIQFKNLKPFLFATQIGTNFYVIIICFLKAAILLEWLRIFSPAGDRSWFYWACYGTLTFNVVWWTQSLIVINVQCKPHALIWDKTLQGTCIQEKLYDVITATLNLLMDLAILLLPQKIIWRLNLSTKRRIGLSFVFAIGLVACVSAAGRLVYTVRYWLTKDGTYEYSAVGLWSVAEMTCGILVFTAPFIPKALGALRIGSLFSTWIKDKSHDRFDPQRGVYPDHSLSFKSGQKKSGRHQDDGIDTQNLVALESFDHLSSTEADLHRQLPGPTAILRTTQVALKYEDAPRSQRNGFAHQEMWAST